MTAVVLDVGETLVDETRHWQAVADAAGVPRLTFFAIAGGLIERDDHHRSVFEVLGVEPVRGPAYEPRDLYPDALPCLRELRRRGYRVGIAANQPAETQALLEQAGCEADFFGMSDAWGLHKPAPEFFERIVESAGLPAGEIAYVGDRLDNDVLPAKRAGMVAVFLRRGPWGYLHALRPEVEQADLRVESLAELPAALADV